MVNTDTRIQYTKSRFYEAIAELLKEKTIGAVTVKELCERAGINRGTFYLHYTEPMDVLRELEEKLKASVSFDLSLGRDVLTENLAILIKNRQLSAAVISRNGDPAFLRRASEDVITRSMPELRKRYPGRGDGELVSTFKYIFAGCTALVQEWLASDEPEEPGEMAKLLLRLSGGVFDTLTI